MTVSALGARAGGGGREGDVHMDAVAITSVGLVVVISLNLFTVVMSRRDKLVSGWAVGAASSPDRGASACRRRHVALLLPD